MDAALRVDGLPALELWDTVQVVFNNMAGNHHGEEPPKHQNLGRLRNFLQNDPWDANDTPEILSDIDTVPISLPNTDRLANLIIFEDNEAVLKCV